MGQVANPLASGTAWRLRPTHADALFLAVLAWGFFAGEAGLSRLLMDGDTGVHIRIGDWVRERRQVPRADLFSFSRPAGEWLAYEWLAGVIFSCAHSVGGLKGVALLAAILLALTPALLAQQAA